MAWEAAFVRLASGHLTAMCQAAGLRLSYSAERSVEDELSRESSTDAGTVLLSYLAMLMCATLASCCACQHRGSAALESPATLRLARAFCSCLDTHAAHAASYSWHVRCACSYIAVALTSLPRGAHWRALLVRSRLGLGIGGVAIVAASVTAALGEQG